MKNSKIELLCNQLRFVEFAQALDKQMQSPLYAEMGFIERIEELLTTQLDANTTRAIIRLTRQAKLRWPNARIEETLAMHSELNVQYIKAIVTCDWVSCHENIIITGCTGVGKTHFACGLANAALQRKLPVLFIRYPDLLLKLVTADREQEFGKLIKRLGRYKVLVIDDWGLAPPLEIERHLLFELIESKEQVASFIITSQYDVTEWYAAFQDQALAEAVIDRLASCAHHFKLRGESARKIRGANKGGSYGAV
ncbi:IS21-like element helper ATPase IstB [Pseudoalteromonas luteoviolacea]|uniref:AAA+ ATPase domain-containing protein n=1 Tax=Pseudoalteromonas luteoviolacea S4060-1 TaxID=1365257 RepID=A0A167JBH6_9GAMM|nr:IS21-like element helper ATPase IstB [Pseudoalteromonas luteoviolacea]KZN60865.1 hypothetical protein N478_26015 [Pseudoalteromonas luteoviolacea S4060-1]MBQ4880555.1 IS21-like element helper ATPase IstB [Pseudoalteromonas luteoviolacea]MBQ4909599.1 IS21-like element helper ATPase IstB [Pseudoalteromonas luteoviolacea]